MNKYFRQVFAVEAGTIVTTDIEPAISIDHNERLVAGVESLQTILGVAELTPMPTGSLVKQYKYTKKNTPEQVAEGETIGLTKYDRTLVNSFEVTLKKYRKQTTAEAIQKSGKDKAVNKTDDLLVKDVQKDVKKAFYGMLATGTGKATAKVATLQGALAAAWGAVSTHFADMDVEPIFFVNTTDVADYLATAQITTQNAFGFKYVEDFLGLGTVVIDPSVTAGTVVATAKENINGAYVSADGDVADTFGLTSDETGLVGMTHYVKGDNACIDTLVMSGVVFYPEDATGVVKATISAATGK